MTAKAKIALRVMENETRLEDLQASLNAVARFVEKYGGDFGREQAAQFLAALVLPALPGHTIYRGGHHVAVLDPAGNRVILIVGKNHPDWE